MTVSAMPSPSTDSVAARLTVEHAAYGLIVLVALALRMSALGRQPFTPAEAEQAWAAMARLDGGAAIAPAGISPLLLSMQLITFLVAQPTEGLARFWPAVAGTLLVLLPYGLRRQLGRMGALAASALLAVSASLTFWSRSGTGESLMLLAALGLVVCMAAVQGTREGRSEPLRWATWLAAGLAVLLISALLAYTTLVLLAALALVWLGARAGAVVRGERWSLTAPIAIFVAVFVLGATALLFNPGGLAAAADLPAEWLRQFTEPAGYSWPWLFVQFALDEPLLLVVGLTGLGLGLRRGRRLAYGLGLWLALSVLLIVLRAGRTPADVALLVLPLAILGGQALGEAVGRIDLRELSWEAAALLVIGIAILGSSAIWLASYANSGTQALSQVFLLYGLGILVLLVPLMVFYAYWVGPNVTLQAGTVLIVLALLLPSLRATLELGLNSDGLRWDSLLNTTGATDGRNMPAFLEQYTRQDSPYGGDPRNLDVAVIVPPGTEPSPLLLWYLRGTEVHLVPGSEAAARFAVVASLAEDVPALGETYSGRSFRLAQSWSPRYLSEGPLWRWLLYGQFDGPLDEQRAVIWVPNAGYD